eukprot:scaffold3234_cov202-Prasinococcus_capsulatus_cf.AAC.1
MRRGRAWVFARVGDRREQYGEAVRASPHASTSVLNSLQRHTPRPGPPPAACLFVVVVRAAARASTINLGGGGGGGGSDASAAGAVVRECA